MKKIVTNKFVLTLIILLALIMLYQLLSQPTTLNIWLLNDDISMDSLKLKNIQIVKFTNTTDETKSVSIDSSTLTITDPDESYNYLNSIISTQLTRDWLYEWTHDNANSYSYNNEGKTDSTGEVVFIDLYDQENNKQYKLSLLYGSQLFVQKKDLANGDMKLYAYKIKMPKG